MLIGKHITITDAKNASLNGKRGAIIDETKNTITIRTAGTTDGQRKDLTIIKDQITTFTLEESS